RRRPRSPLFPYTTLFRSLGKPVGVGLKRIIREHPVRVDRGASDAGENIVSQKLADQALGVVLVEMKQMARDVESEALDLDRARRSEEHTSELQSLAYLVC